ncbi:hypothetical protein B2A_13104, partial [mine drainage metagenome]
MSSKPETPADAWLASARQRIDATVLEARTEQIGRVESVSDGIAMVS